MTRSADPEAQRRALELMEAAVDADGDSAEDGETQEVLAELARLREAAPRARRAFPTEEDRLFQRAAMPLPERVGAYRLTHLLGEGGMGVVFAAERDDGLFEHGVAVKLIHPERFGETSERRFARERRILARLRHPAIARLLDGGVTAEGWPYIIMERVDGQPIDLFATERALPTHGRVELVRAICVAVEAAHGALVVHGDLKPANVLVEGDGSVRLLDFGVARLLGDDDGGALEPRTACYAAPERMLGGQPSVAGDIYALGVLLGTLLDGSADRDLTAICAKAAAADPADRYGSVATLAEDLARWTKRRPVTARPLSASQRLGLYLRRNRTPVLVAMSVMAALVIALIVAMAGWHEASERVRDVRDVARYQLVDVDRRLARMPHTIELRVQLAEEAQGVLDRLMRSGRRDPGLAMLTAEGYRRLALLQGASDRPSLGDRAAARVNLDTAEALARRAGSPAAALLAQTLIDHARVELADLRHDAARVLLTQVPREPLHTDRLIASQYHLVRSEWLQWSGRYDEAVAEGLSAQRLIGTEPTSIDEALLLSRAYDAIAEARFYAEDLPGSAAVFRKALAVLEEAGMRWSSGLPVETRIDRARWQLGSTLTELGETTEALHLLRLAMLGSRKRASADPRDRTAARVANVFALAFAQVLARSGDEAGLGIADRALSERELWWRRSPRDRERIRDWMVGLTSVGDILVESGRDREACLRYVFAIRLANELARSGRLPQLDRDHALTLVREQMAKHCSV